MCRFCYTKLNKQSYHHRAPSGKKARDYPQAALSRRRETRQSFTHLICLAPVDGEKHRTVRAGSNSTSCSIFWTEVDRYLGGNHEPSIAVPNPATTPVPGSFSITDLLSWAFLETADFQFISITRSGVLFHGWLHDWYAVDQGGLETGRLAVVEFKVNEEITNSILRRPYNMFPMYLWYDVLGKDIAALQEHHIGGFERYQNKP